MKHLSKLTMILSLIIACTGYAKAMDTVRNAGPKIKNFFVFKTSRKLIGAKVEILSSAGNLITSSQLNKRKLIIDFGGVHFGAYTIRVSKGALQREFIYIKKD
jgi:hypothetical protein